NRLLVGRGRRERGIGLPRLDGHAEVVAIPGRQRLGVAGLEEHPADADDPLHASLAFVLRHRSTSAASAPDDDEPEYGISLAYCKRWRWRTDGDWCPVAHSGRPRRCQQPSAAAPAEPKRHKPPGSGTARAIVSADCTVSDPFAGTVKVHS